MSLKDLFTGKDNQTHDLGRWSWAISMLTVVGGAAYKLHLGQDVSLSDMAQAISLVVAAHGVALWAKRDTEPN